MEGGIEAEKKAVGGRNWTEKIKKRKERVGGWEKGALTSQNSDFFRRVRTVEDKAHERKSWNLRISKHTCQSNQVRIQKEKASTKP